MPVVQSEYASLTALFKGSAKVEVAARTDSLVAAISGSKAGTDSASWVNCGLVTGLKFGDGVTAQILRGDNGEYYSYVSQQEFKVSFDQNEIFFEAARAIMRGSFDTKETTAASTVSGAEQVVASGDAAYATPIVIENQNGDGSALTINSVTGGTDGALVEDTDYSVLTMPDGRTAISLISGGNITTLAQTFTIDYDYTPYASVTIHSGGKTTMPDFMVRITNTDEDGKVIRVWVYKCALDTGYDISTKSDIDGNPIGTNATAFTGRIDTSIATLGKQLFKFYSERGLE